jgi:hypothetical protein
VAVWTASYDVGFRFAFSTNNINKALRHRRLVLIRRPNKSYLLTFEGSSNGIEDQLKMLSHRLRAIPPKFLLAEFLP